FCTDSSTTEISTLSLHDALPICVQVGHEAATGSGQRVGYIVTGHRLLAGDLTYSGHDAASTSLLAGSHRPVHLANQRQGHGKYTGAPAKRRDLYQSRGPKSNARAKKPSHQPP